MSRNVGGVSRSSGMSSSANAASSIRSCSSRRASEASRGSVACAGLLIGASPAEEAEVDVHTEEHAAADHQEQTGKHGGGGDAGDLRRGLLRFAPQELGVVPADVVADG